MRSRITLVLITGMLLLLVYLVGSRTRDPHVMPPPRAEESSRADAEHADGAAPGALASAAPPASVASVASAPSAAPAGSARSSLLGRPLRIVSASWELAASALVANGGRATADGSPMRAAGLDAQIDVVEAARDVDNRLARGGADPEGADVAVVPLPALAASYEKLRALEPQVVHVVAWSRGREVLFGARDAALAKPAAPGAEAVLASGDVTATALGLFALDEGGTAAGRVHVVSDPKGAAFEALVRPMPGDRPAEAPSKLLLSTADASRLVPFVAVAARAFAEAHVEAFAALGRAWLEGAARLRSDVPAAARSIAAEPGAPEPATMLERLGWMQDASAADEARALGLAGHDAVTVASLFARDWSLLREAGTLTSPAPEVPPVATAAMAKVLPADAPAPAPAAAPAPQAGARVLLAHRVDKADADALAADIAWLAGVFERSALRVSARSANLAKDAASAAHDKFDVAAERISTASAPPGDGSAARIEVLAAP